MLGGLLYFIYIPELTPVAPPIAIEQATPEPEPELNITVLQTLPDFASVLIDLPSADNGARVLKTAMKTGILNIRYGDTEKHIPIFPSSEGVILHSELTNNRLILEVSKQ